MKTIIINIISLLLLFCITLSAQSESKADKIYNQLGYKEAIQLYRSGDLTLEKMERIAHGYRLNHDTQNAEKWYSQIADESDDPLNLLYYAQALHSNGNLEKAKEYYQKYDAKKTGNDKRGQLLAGAIERISSFTNNESIEVSLAKTINSPKLDFSPAYFHNGVVFVSNRQPEGVMKKGFSEKDLWTGDDYNTHYFAKENTDGSLAKPEVFSLNLDDKFHEGPLIFSKSGDQVFFTRNISKKKKSKEYNLKIFTAYQEGDDFMNTEKLDLGDPEANDAHPALSPGGQRLYFASNREGGYGGMDIWMSTFSGGEWSSPENLGPNINTAGNEVFPFIYEDGTLYFASDGWGGLGGLDIFYAQSNEKNNTWQAPENLGKPFNSSKDDFSYILNPLGTEGYFTSARDGGSGLDDIYHFKLTKPQGNIKKEPQVFAKICTFDEQNNSRLAGVQVNVLVEASDGSFEGTQGDFIVKLTPTDTDGEYAISFKKRDPFGDVSSENDTYHTNNEGHFDLEVKPGRKYIFIAKMDGYHETRQEFSSDDLRSQNGEFCIPLRPAECLSLYGTVKNRRYGNNIPKATVTLIDLCSGDALTTTTDEEGFYEFPCVPCGCDFIIRGEKTNFKEDNGLASTVDMECVPGEAISTDLRLNPVYEPDGTRAIVKQENGGYNPNVNTSPNGGNGPVEVNPNGYLPPNVDDLLARGLPIELKDIYYDFDEFYIRTPDADSDLDKLVKVLKRNPELYVELGSHTDSRGTYDYNIELSARRAEAAVAYIVEQGIEPDRITARGYGETELVNECSDGVTCSERDHQMNRRTEVKVFRR
jgi:outer membrane protein OmpA-like peptidoglycan-associated protein/tetratricopeptide (TPR) repeat protein